MSRRPGRAGVLKLWVPPVKLKFGACGLRKGVGSLGCRVHPCRCWHRRTRDRVGRGAARVSAEGPGGPTVGPADHAAASRHEPDVEQRRRGARARFARARLQRHARVGARGAHPVGGAHHAALLLLQELAAAPGRGQHRGEAGTVLYCTVLYCA
eukprot:178116-Prorocentrum_minimum.AAC.1